MDSLADNKQYDLSSRCHDQPSFDNDNNNYMDSLADNKQYDLSSRCHDQTSFDNDNNNYMDSPADNKQYDLSSRCHDQSSFDNDSNNNMDSPADNKQYDLSSRCHDQSSFDNDSNNNMDSHSFSTASLADDYSVPLLSSLPSTIFKLATNLVEQFKSSFTDSQSSVVTALPATNGPVNEAAVISKWPPFPTSNG
jgi:hypothetical protein